MLGVKSERTAAASAGRRATDCSHLDFIVGLDTFFQAHLLLQVEAELFQATEDAVVIRCLGTLILPTAICGAREDRRLVTLILMQKETTDNTKERNWKNNLFFHKCARHLIPECHSSFSWLLLLWSSSAGLPFEQSSSSASSSSPSSSSSSSASSSSSTAMLLLSWSISVARLLKSSWPSGGFPLKSPALTSGVLPISSPSSCSRRSMEAWMFRRSSYSDTLGKREFCYWTLCTRVGGKRRDYKTISHSALWLQAMFILLFVLWLFFIFCCLIQVLNLQVVVLGGIGVRHCGALLRTEEPAKVWQGARPEHLRVRSGQRI